MEKTNATGRTYGAKTASRFIYYKQVTPTELNQKKLKKVKRMVMLQFKIAYISQVWKVWHHFRKGQSVSSRGINRLQFHWEQK